MKIYDVFKRNDEGKTEIKPRAVILIIVLAAVFLLFSKGGENGGGKTNKAEEAQGAEVSADKSEYFKESEERLEKILSGIDGAGEVDVMIYYANTGKKIVASDSKEKSEKGEKGSGYFESSDTAEKSTVLYGQGSGERPFVTEERLPKPDGVLVLAPGAKNEKIKYEITEAVRALLGVAPNRIRVSPKINKNN